MPVNYDLQCDALTKTYRCDCAQTSHASANNQNLARGDLERLSIIAYHIRREYNLSK